MAAPTHAEPTAIAWGPVRKGLQAGLRILGEHGPYAQGETIRQEAYLRNTTARDVTIQAIGGYEDQGAPSITDARGARVKVVRFFGEGMMFTVNATVHPGEIGLVGQFAVIFQNSPHREVAPGLSFEAEETPLATAGSGTYSLAQDLTPIGADGKPLGKPIRTGSVPIQINNAPPLPIRLTNHNAVSDLSTAPIAWGVEHNGLQAGLLTIGERSHYFAGERVRLAVVLRNVSKLPISFWHETDFKLMETPRVIASDGAPRPVTLMPETEWHTLSGIKMTGVTFDMTSAPSADGPAHLHQSEIAPGQAVLGYCLAGFTVPAHWKVGQPTAGHYRAIQPLRLGLGNAEQLDTTLDTGALELVLSDPDR